MDDRLERYSRQYRFGPLGKEGQRRIQQSRVCVCGCGALGTVLANGLVRAGVGFVRIVDRDFIETNNLQRQLLFDEADVEQHLPKAVAAAEKLRQINHQVTVDPVVADLDHTNIQTLCGDVDVILDGTDNFETRFLINDFALDRNIPWVYGGCIGSEGQCLTIVPGTTCCLRCLVATIPPPGSTPTCETAGILASASMIVASFQLAEALKIVSGNRDAVNTKLTVIDVWENRVRQLDVSRLREQDCPACTQRDFAWLEGKAGAHTTRLCGRNAVQVVPSEKRPLDPASLRRSLEGIAQVSENPFLIRFEVDGYQFSVFTDGRAIIKGTDDIAIARALYARYVGT